MNLFVCHTPLHVLISLLVARECHHFPSVFVIVEDSVDLHGLANKIIRKDFGEIHFLPGLATYRNGVHRALMMRSNVKYLLAQFGSALAELYLFNDLRAETQALLNSCMNHDAARCVLLEDGVGFYEPGGRLQWGVLAILKQRFAAGGGWMKGDELGFHPGISEIRSFYPELLKPHLKKKAGRPLPVNVEALDLAGAISIPKLKDSSAIVVVPHTAFLTQDYIARFINAVLAYCGRHGIEPIFKLHPSDRSGVAVLAKFLDDPAMLPQQLPMEMVVLGASRLHSVIGARTSSMHIIKRIYPETRVAYFEEKSDLAYDAWSSFLEKTGVFPLADIL